jgi:hypothetical protein
MDCSDVDAFRAVAQSVMEFAREKTVSPLP